MTDAHITDLTERLAALNESQAFVTRTLFLELAKDTTDGQHEALYFDLAALFDRARDRLLGKETTDLEHEGQPLARDWREVRFPSDLPTCRFLRKLWEAMAAKDWLTKDHNVAVLLLGIVHQLRLGEIAAKREGRDLEFIAAGTRRPTFEWEGATARVVATE